METTSNESIEYCFAVTMRLKGGSKLQQTFVQKTNDPEKTRLAIFYRCKQAVISDYEDGHCIIFGPA